MTSEENSEQQPHLSRGSSCSFSIRLWLAQTGPGEMEWRGQLLSIATGEVRYFRDWQKLITHLRDLLRQSSIGPVP